MFVVEIIPAAIDGVLTFLSFCILSFHESCFWKVDTEAAFNVSTFWRLHNRLSQEFKR